jgi:hypothetical protein
MDIPPYHFYKTDHIYWPVKKTRTQRAYILFYNKSKQLVDDIILSGKSSYSNKWSGFGGGRKDFEDDPKDTAIRECVEELFGWVYDHRKKQFSFNRRHIHYSVIHTLIMAHFNELKYFFSLSTDPDSLYVIYIVSFSQLERFIQTLYHHYRHMIQSPFYSERGAFTLPSNIMNLIETRRVSQQTKENFRGEIDSIQTFKIHDILSEDQISIDDYFKKDLTFFQTLLRDLKR